MANLDGGHYFLTALMPVQREPLLREDGNVTSPGHLLRETLATLPTAQQSPACVAAGHKSPFSRCTRTHFVRAAVIDQPMYNGRDGGNALVQGLRRVNLLAHQPVDNLSCPYLLFTADFDAEPGEADGGLQSWCVGLWHKMEPELRAVFSPCLGFAQVDGAEAFAAWIVRCQVETTMSFNDYYVPMPDLHGYTGRQVTGWVAAGTAVLSLAAHWRLHAAGLSAWWLLAAVPVAAVLALAAALWLLWRKGRRPFPAGAGTDLPSVLKALHVQQRFAGLAAQLQGADAVTLHQRFGQFLREVRPGDTSAPTQPPGVIRSDGVPLVAHRPVAARQGAA